jgi:hypothetical protein
MRRTIVLMTLTLALLPAGANAGREVGGRPTLVLAKPMPLTLRGAHFKPDERIRVTVKGLRKGTKRASADSNGVFVVRFSGVAFDRCDGLMVLAVGSLGSRASLKRPQPLCPPRL